MATKHIIYKFSDYHDAYGTEDGRISIAYHIPNCLATVASAISKDVQYFQTSYEHIHGLFNEPILTLGANCIPGIMESTEYNHASPEDVATRSKYVIPAMFFLDEGLNISTMSGLTLNRGEYEEDETEYQYTYR